MFLLNTSFCFEKCFQFDIKHNFIPFSKNVLCFTQTCVMRGIYMFFLLFWLLPATCAVAHASDVIECDNYFMLPEFCELWGLSNQSNSKFRSNISELSLIDQLGFLLRFLREILPFFFLLSNQRIKKWY